jgi:hypothetical protein
MKDRLKHTLQGSLIGAALAMIIGFSWLGWTLDSTAKKMAQDQSNSAVVTALTPICVQRFMRQPDAAAKLVELKKASSWDQRDVIEKGGWATLAGAKSPNSELARGCAEALLKVS